VIDFVIGKSDFGWKNPLKKKIYINIKPDLFPPEELV